MKRTVIAATTLGTLVAGLTIGCNMRPSPPKTRDGKVPDLLYVSPINEAERAAVIAFETARINYKYRLEVLREFLLQKGRLDEHNWATKELENLEEAVTFSWGNIPEILPPKGESFELTDSRALVEYNALARKKYLDAVEELAQFYERHDPESYKARRIRNMRERFFLHQTYLYFPEAEIPGPELRPTEVVPEADQLYSRAMKLYRSGQIAPGITLYDKEREALTTLVRLVREHPRSTKIALSAYYIGTIYKEYFGEYVLAVRWYERAWQWDPTVTEPARFQAAVVYDIALHDAPKAVELYKASLEHDPPRLGQAATCQRRIIQLTEQLREADGEKGADRKPSP